MLHPAGCGSGFSCKELLRCSEQYKSIEERSVAYSGEGKACNTLTSIFEAPECAT